MKKKNFLLEVIQAAVVNNGFEFDMEDSMLDIFSKAEESLLDSPAGYDFVRTELWGHGMKQGYTFTDDATGFSKTMNGEIFDFGKKKAEDNVYFRADGKGGFDAINWFDLPEEGDCRRQYIFVFAREVQSNGRVAMLYDYFK